MTILPLVVGDLHTNCYLAIDESTNKCLVIDPADEGDFISTTIIEEKLTPVGIVLTHGHYDHCLAALELKLNFDIPIYLHKADLFLYKNAAKSANFWSPSLRDSYSNRGNPGIRHSGLGHAKVLGTRGETIKIIPLPPIDHFLDDGQDRKSTRLNSSHSDRSRMPSSA
jgi:glyoxylase-like metal-dependent hydrolase (beta-lactamase superfamily II)